MTGQALADVELHPLQWADGGPELLSVIGVQGAVECGIKSVHPCPSWKCAFFLGGWAGVLGAAAVWGYGVEERGRSPGSNENRFVEQIVKASLNFFDKPKFYEKKLDSKCDIFAIKTRGLFKNPVEYDIQVMSDMLCNEKPLLSKAEEAIARRIRVIEFLMKFVHNPSPNNPYEILIDETLKNKIKGDVRYRDALVNILLELWDKEDLLDVKAIIVPEEVKKASEEYINSSNDVKNWIDENYTICDKILEEKSGNWEQASQLYNNFKKQTKSTMSALSFSERLKKLGIKKTGSDGIPKNNRGTFYVNIKYLDIEE